MPAPLMIAAWLAAGGTGLWGVDTVTNGGISSNAWSLFEWGAPGTASKVDSALTFGGYALETAGWALSGLYNTAALATTAVTDPYMFGTVFTGAALAAQCLDRNEFLMRKTAWSPWGPSAMLGVSSTFGTIAAVTAGLITVPFAAPIFAAGLGLLTSNMFFSPNQVARNDASSQQRSDEERTERKIEFAGVREELKEIKRRLPDAVPA